MGSTTGDIGSTLAAYDYSGPITYEPSSSPTPYPTYSFERLDEDRSSNDEGTPMMRAYATIGFIIRIFLPIILIVMCCRMKRREAEQALRARATGTGFAGGDASDNQTRMDPEERKRYVEEKLLTKKVIEATDGQPVPSFADDIVAKGDMLIPKDQTVSTADDSQGNSQSNINEENGDAGGEAGGGGGGAIVASDEDVWYESEEPSCSICLCAYEPGDDICWSCNTRCTHAFHVECMSEWLQNHNDCPQCRREYLKSDAECSAEEEEEEKEEDADKGEDANGEDAKDDGGKVVSNEDEQRQQQQQVQPQPPRVRMRAFLVVPDAVASNDAANAANDDDDDDDDGGPTAKKNSVDQSVVTKLVEVHRSLWRQHELEMKADDKAGGGDESATATATTMATAAATTTANASAASNGTASVPPSGETVVSSSGGGDQQQQQSLSQSQLQPQSQSQDNSGMIKLDVARVAAAAGGGDYDEDNDPLNAPEVLTAVAAFKKRFGERDLHLRKRRVEIVDARLSEEKGRARVRLIREEEERKRLEADAAARAAFADAVGSGNNNNDDEDKKASEESTTGTPTAAIPPPEVAAAAPPIAAPGGAVESGKRGVSNLPAWMSKTDNEDEQQSRKRKFVPSEANRDINARKQRIDAGDGGMTMAEIRAANEAADRASAAAAAAAAAPATAPTASAADPKTMTREQILQADTSFPPIPSPSVPKVLQYVKEQIVDLLGEEEVTMINFVIEQLTVPKGPSGCLVSDLLEEMKQVLDEDAEAFVVGLFGVVANLS
mmetsp:Transcript_27462/g.61006  ORF Transcript_27462/g.61006 Transcript_27462/m.61006 type:complete len:780 (+) Transcript_27462:228-2567(+)